MSYLKTINMIKIGLSVALIACAGLPAIAGPNASTALRQGLPGRRISGGTRSECMAGSAPIVALNPTTNLGETLSDRPSVYFVIPEMETAYPLAFSLRDSEGNRIYEKALDTHDSNGIVGIQLPPQSLKVNQDYRWYLSVVCEAQDPSQNDVLSGWLRQVDTEFEMNNSLDIAAHTDINNGLELARQYKEVGLWNDFISTLVSLREQHPTDSSVQHSWNQLLQALEIETVGAPIAMR